MNIADTIKMKADNALIRYNVARQIVVSVTVVAVVNTVAYSVIKNPSLGTRIAVGSGGLLLGYEVNKRIDEYINKNYWYNVKSV